jgi:hypothetical protein
VAEFDPSPPRSSDSAIELSPKPGTSEGEEIQPPKFPSQFEDDPSGNHENTSNFFDTQLGEEPSSLPTSRPTNPLTEPIPMGDLIEQVTIISPLVPPESILEKDVEHFKEDDSGEALHLLTKQPSSPSIKLKTSPTRPQDAKPFKKENPWAWRNLRCSLLSPSERILQTSRGASSLKNHKNHAHSMPLQSQAHFMPRAPARTATTLRSALVKSLGGWL